MADLELNKVLKNIDMSKTQFAELHDLSRQTLNNRFRNGWKVGYIDGALSMYNPTDIQKVKIDLVSDFFDFRLDSDCRDTKK